MYPSTLLLLASLPLLYGQIHLYSRQEILQGDTQCGTLMCIAATVNGTTTSYVLSDLGKQHFGWMAIGFGRQMANTPMIILWVNSDQTITLSQRIAPQKIMPTVDANPPRLASLSISLSTISTSTPQLAFTVPTNDDRTQSIIYAYGTTSPGSPAVDAPLIKHLDYGTLQLDLAKSIPTSASGNPTLGSLPTGGSSAEISWLPYQRMIVAHAIFCVFGFLFLLPAGVLLARYMRTFNTSWFKFHWAIQFPAAGITILIGVILGIASVMTADADHLDDDHKRWGIAIFILYVVQCALGSFIHFIKDPHRIRRPPQNYVHAILGLLVIALALYQVRLGYHVEWQKTTGLDALPGGANVIFWIWVILLPVLYVIGLSFLPKQHRQEGKDKKAPE